MSQKWIQIDATGQNIGRLSTSIATKLMGKDLVDYAPNKDAGRSIVVINCAALPISERRGMELKYRHSGYLGNLKETKKKDIPGSKLLSEAVRGMLPKNKLGSTLLKRLHCYQGNEHPYQGQINE